jgi:hypothetical protein
MHTLQQMKTFLLIWAGQLVSLTGSHLTGFALGVWVYQQTGSVTQFAFISVATVLPYLLISPLAGAIVDRWDRRWTMIVSDTGAGLSTLTLAGLFLNGQLEVWHIYLATALSATFSAFQGPAYAASTTLLVPKEQLGRANGLVQMAQATGMLVAPAIAGFLVTTIQLQGVMLIDGITFLFALTTLLLVRFPRPTRTHQTEVKSGSLWRDVVYGWRYLVARPALLGLMIFFGINNFLVGVVDVLFTPLVLSLGSAELLGILLSTGGLGMLTGSVAMSIWGGPKRRVYGVFGFSGLLAAAILLAGLRPTPLVLGIAAFLAFFSLPIFQGSNQALMQTKIAPEVQGRAFALKEMIAVSTLPLAYLVAGPLADGFFEPLLAVGGPLAGSVGSVIGVGPGRGIALLFVVMGLASLLLSLAGYLQPRLRRVEEELPEGEVAESLPSVGSYLPNPVKAGS